MSVSGAAAPPFGNGTGVETPSAPAAARARAIILPIETLLLGGLLTANVALAVLWPSRLTALAAMLLWLLAIARLFVADPGVVVMLVPFIIMHLSVIGSLNAIEAGAFMWEMGSSGQPATASASYVLYSLLFLCSAALACGRRREPGRTRPALAPGSRLFWLDWAAVATGAAIVAYLFFVGSRAGFPLLTGTDRFQFRTMTADILTLNFLNLKAVLAAFLGSSAVLAATTASRACHHLTFLGYVLVSFLFGDKFFIILIAASFYAMPFLIHNPGNVTRSIVRSAPWTLLAICSVLAITMFIYSDYGRLGIGQTVMRLGDRAAGQGQLWYLAVRDASHAIGFDTGIVRENLSSLLANPAATYVFEHRLGPFYFVERYSPSSLYMSFIHNSGAITPTMVFEAYGLVAFGYVGLAGVLISAGCLIGLLLRWLARQMMSDNPFNVLLPAFAVTQALSMMSQATLYSMIGRSAWKAYAAFLALQLGVAYLVSLQRKPQGRR